MGLCFIGKRKFSRFISQYIPDNIGYVKSIETNEIIGEHYGLHRYTIGQRISPINSHRYKPSKPLYIAKKDPIENIIYAVRNSNSTFRIFSFILLKAAGTNHSALFTKSFNTETPHWINNMPLFLKETKQYQCDFRFQHKHRPLSVLVSLANNNTLHVSLPIPIRSICPGQVKERNIIFIFICFDRFILVCSFL
jgi:tRNA U34 2-thiouridine synthase MnmA/TrmU